MIMFVYKLFVYIGANEIVSKAAVFCRNNSIVFILGNSQEDALGKHGGKE